jgi:hypothetical protein
MLVLGKPFQISLDKTGACPIEEPFRFSTLG